MLKNKVRWLLVFYDAIVYLLVSLLLRSFKDSLVLTIGGLLILVVVRILIGVYSTIWRYAGPSEYIRLLLTDALATSIFIIIETLLPNKLRYVRIIVLFMSSALISLGLRHLYQWIYQHRANDTFIERFFLKLLDIFTIHTM